MNSPITQPAYEPPRKKEEALKFYEGLINDSNPAVKGWCKTCGAQGSLYPATRCEMPLSGAGTDINLHHAHEVGSYICRECMVKLFFVPLAVFQCGDKLALLHAQDELQRKVWTDLVIHPNIDKLAKGSADGILRTDYKNPRNALFHITSEIIKAYTLDQTSLGTQHVSLLIEPLWN